MRVPRPLDQGRQNTSIAAVVIAAFFASVLYTTNGCGGSSSPTAPSGVTLQGTVTSAPGSPVGNVNVTATQGSVTVFTTTGSNGRYTLNGLATGNARVEATAPGYAPFSTNVTLGAGMNTYDIRLQPSP